MSDNEPTVETRRTPEFRTELARRARAWIPDWHPDADPAGAADADKADFGRALLDIAARFSAEVAERLARIPEKTARGFLDWLGVCGAAARPARVPVVFRLVATAPRPVLALAPVKLQASVGDAGVMFETEADLQLAPGQLRAIVGVDAGADAFYLPPPGLADPVPQDGLPDGWRIKSYAAPGATRLQLDPALGLAPGLLLEADGAQYRITEVNGDLACIDPPLDAGPAGDGLFPPALLRRVQHFAPFAGARNRQMHALYLGDEHLLDLEAAATIEVAGLPALPEGVRWAYWGKRDGADDTAWQRLHDVKVQADGSIRMSKGKGSIDVRQLGAAKARWLRASIATAAGVPAASDALALGINPGAAKAACPFEAYDPKSAPVLEGVANNVPLVLDKSFYPFGREPRQSDAFYLGCAEAFSKPGALVDLCIQVASANLGPLAALQVLRPPDTVLAGVGIDRLLYLLQLSETAGKLSVTQRSKPGQPALAPDGTVTPGGARVPLDPAPPWRPAVWTEGNDFYVAVAAGLGVWVWHDVADSPNISAWQSFGQLKPRADGNANAVPASIDGIVHVLIADDAALVALCGGRLYKRTLAGAPAWAELFPKWVVSDLRALVPVGVQPAGQLLAVSTNGDAYAIGLATGVDPVALKNPAFAAGIRPVAWRDGPRLRVAGAAAPDADGASTALLFLDWNPDAVDTARLETLAVPLALSGGAPFAVYGTVLDALVDDRGARSIVVLGQQKPNAPQLLAWSPDRDDKVVTAIPMPASTGVFRAAGPCVDSQRVVLPGEQAALLIGVPDLKRSRRLTFDPATDMTHALFGVPDGRLAPGDLLARSKSLDTPIDIDRAIPVGADSKEQAWLLAKPLGASAGALCFYAHSRDGRVAEVMAGSARTRRKTVLIVATKREVDDGDVLYVVSPDVTGMYRVTGSATDPASGKLAVTLHMAVGGNETEVRCWLPQALAATLLPVLKLARDATGPWDASTFEAARFRFAGDGQDWIRPLHWSLPDDGSVVIAFSAFPPDARSVDVAADSAPAWSSALGETTSNPELSWEYWNGTGWWSIAQVADGTANLKHDGLVRLRMPADVRPTDWAGKTTHWIRARLVGGDYGREKVTVDPADNSVRRDTDAIHAPLVVLLQLRYQVDRRVAPAWVLTEDSASLRDQSDANRTGGAQVELFAPLAATLGRLGGGAGLATGRALYLGFDAPLQDGPYGILFKAAAEHDYDAYAPLRLDVLDGAAQTAVVASDGTRALGETGVLSFRLSAARQSATLFGQALHWLRLQPAATCNGDWQPDLAGAYLNAVWARAAETQAMEMLASSDGAPGQVVFLARPPVLDATLDLRVREPLGAEERAALLQGDPDAVQSAVPGQPGDWVRWRQVADPADSGGADRVYGLDEASGRIVFGDGIHGAIPPRGRNAIMAFRYQRTEAATPGAMVPANGVAAGASLAVVTPVESVEAAVAADRAAGGAGADDAARIQRFGPARVRQRGRLVTPQDFEQMALQLVPGLAQARWLAGHGGSGPRLVLVMGGPQPLAGRARKRALRRDLLAAAAPSLAAQGRLALADPVLRRIDVRLALTTASLDDSGRLANDATTAILALFDPATGGHDGQGWRLGSAPMAADIAACLLDLPQLDSIVAATLSETGAAGRQPAPASLGPDQLAVAGALELAITLAQAPR